MEVGDKVLWNGIIIINQTEPEQVVEIVDMRRNYTEIITFTKNKWSVALKNLKPLLTAKLEALME